MRVTDLRGREVPWNLVGCRVIGDEARPRSGLHLRARAVIRRTFPLEQVYEEVPIPGSRMRGDFLIPGKMVLVEVQGEQHFRFNTHHYRAADMASARAKFRDAMARDREKARFCDINDIRLVALRYDEPDESWERTLRET